MSYEDVCGGVDEDGEDDGESDEGGGVEFALAANAEEHEGVDDGGEAFRAEVAEGEYFGAG